MLVVNSLATHRVLFSLLPSLLTILIRTEKCEVLGLVPSGEQGPEEGTAYLLGSCDSFAMDHSFVPVADLS